MKSFLSLWSLSIISKNYSYYYSIGLICVLTYSSYIVPKTYLTLSLHLVDHVFAISSILFKIYIYNNLLDLYRLCYDLAQGGIRVPCPPFASSSTRFLSVDPVCFCLISGIVGFSLHCVVWSLRLEWGVGVGRRELVWLSGVLT